MLFLKVTGTYFQGQAADSLNRLTDVATFNKYLAGRSQKVSIWTEKAIVESDEISMLALALFIVATAGLESMMMVSCLLHTMVGAVNHSLTTRGFDSFHPFLRCNYCNNLPVFREAVIGRPRGSSQNVLHSEGVFICGGGGVGVWPCDEYHSFFFLFFFSFFFLHVMCPVLSSMSRSSGDARVINGVTAKARKT